MNFKSSFPIILIVVLLLVAGFVFIKFLELGSTAPSSKLQIFQTPSLSSTTKKEVSYNCQPGKTAFETLQENHNQVNYQGSSFGRMITGINGVSQGNGKYWLYSVDGKDATVSADAYICQGNEKIKWELK